MKLFVGEPDFLKGNCSAYGKVCKKRKARCFPHDFERFSLKKQNVEVKKGIGLCCRIFNHFDADISNVFIPTRKYINSSLKDAKNHRNRVNRTCRKSAIKKHNQNAYK